MANPVKIGTKVIANWRVTLRYTKYALVDWILIHLKRYGVLERKKFLQVEKRFSTGIPWKTREKRNLICSFEFQNQNLAIYLSHVFPSLCKSNKMKMTSLFCWLSFTSNFKFHFFHCEAILTIPLYWPVAHCKILLYSHPLKKFTKG